MYTDFMINNYKYPRFMNVFFATAIGVFVAYLMSETTEFGVHWFVLVAVLFLGISVFVLNYVYDRN